MRLVLVVGLVALKCDIAIFVAYDESCMMYLHYFSGYT